jgi:protein involved in polysaccharide export with SLBB domain
MKNGESAATLLKYAGGFASDAYKKSIRVLRKDGKEFSVKTVNDIDYSAFKLLDGDVISVDSILNRFNNRLEVKGAVYHPGVFELSGSLNTVRQLVEKADGLLGDAFTGRAVLYRERENLTKEVLPVDIQGILNGTSPDIALQKNDILYIPSIHDLQDMGKVTISGEVNRHREVWYLAKVSNILLMNR